MNIETKSQTDPKTKINKNNSSENTIRWHKSYCKENHSTKEFINFEKSWEFLPAAFCICLNDREDRLKESTKQFHRVGLCNKVMFYRPVKDQTGAKRPGTRGCWESHRTIVTKAKNELNLDYCAIFEDDVLWDEEISPEWIQKAGEQMKNLPNDWRLYFLGHWSIFAFPKISNVNVLRTWSLSTHAYIISSIQMDWIIDHPYEELLAVKYGNGFGIDCYFMLAQKSFAYFPMLCYQSGSPSSNPKPKVGGNILDFALSDPRYMKTSQYLGIGTFLFILGVLICATSFLILKITPK